MSNESELSAALCRIKTLKQLLSALDVPGRVIYTHCDGLVLQSRTAADGGWCNYEGRLALEELAEAMTDTWPEIVTRVKAATSAELRCLRDAIDAQACAAQDEIRELLKKCD